MRTAKTTPADRRRVRAAQFQARLLSGVFGRPFTVADALRQPLRLRPRSA